MAVETAPARPTPRPLRALGFWLATYRRTWHRTLVSGLLTPALYLAAMGLGLGSLVKASHGAVDGVSYLDFLAPGLLAATCMQTAVVESTWPVLGAIKWTRTYHAMLATPLAVADVLAGHALWVVLRMLLTATMFVAVMGAFGTLHSWSALALVPAGALTGLAFGLPVMAFSATAERDSAFAVIYRFGVVPLFLFSGTFFPLSQLPAVLRPVAYVTPLWHGVELCRGIDLGTLGLAAALGHVAVLLAFAAAGGLTARATFRRRLSR